MFLTILLMSLRSHNNVAIPQVTVMGNFRWMLDEVNRHTGVEQRSGYEPEQYYYATTM